MEALLASVTGFAEMVKTKKRAKFRISSIFKTYRKYYNLYPVFTAQPNQMVYTNLDWTEKSRLEKKNLKY